MNQRKLREVIFTILFEHELSKNDIFTKKDEMILSLNLEDSKKKFFEEYIIGLKKEEENIKQKIKSIIKGWTFSRIGNVEKVILKMAFYEIEILKVPYEIVINEVLELSKIYGDENSKSFINGILADLVKTEK